MLSVDQAQSRILDAIRALNSESVPLPITFGRVLADDQISTRTQPPFAASAMDGYAVRFQDIHDVPHTLKVIGEAPAGAAFSGYVDAGEAVRIFTGGPMPKGADTVVIQENTERTNDEVRILSKSPCGKNVRRAGVDFSVGDLLLPSGVRLNERHIALLAAANIETVQVSKKPRVAILSTGTELVPLGTEPGPSGIVNSNGLALAVLLAQEGADIVDLGIAPDNRSELASKLSEADGADLLITIGGASVGEHDLVQDVLTELGFELNFWKVAIRPGKPLLFGEVFNAPVFGLPGNPVSAYVTARLFVIPALRALQGMTTTIESPTRLPLAADISQNGPRQAYLRASIKIDPSGQERVELGGSQDSSVLASLAGADCLIVRSPDAPELKAGELTHILRI